MDRNRSKLKDWKFQAVPTRKTHGMIKRPETKKKNRIRQGLNQSDLDKLSLLKIMNSSGTGFEDITIKA